MTPGVSLIWGQITVPTVLWCIKLIACVLECLRDKTHVPTHKLTNTPLCQNDQLTSSSLPLQDTTPACTPSLLEKRKSMVVGDDEDDEIVIKMPAVEKGEEGSSSEEEESEEPSEEEEEAEWKSSLFYCGLGALVFRVKSQTSGSQGLIRFESRFELNHSVSVRNRITFAKEDSTLDGVCYIITMGLIHEQCVCGLLWHKTDVRFSLWAACVICHKGCNVDSKNIFVFCPNVWLNFNYVNWSIRINDVKKKKLLLSCPFLMYCYFSEEQVTKKALSYTNHNVGKPQVCVDLMMAAFHLAAWVSLPHWDTHRTQIWVSTKKEFSK